MPTQGQDPDDGWEFKISLKPRTKKAAATIASVATIAGVVILEQRAGMSLADIVFAAKVVNGK